MLFVIAKTGNNLKYPSVRKWISNNIEYSYNGICTAVIVSLLDPHDRSSCKKKSVI